MTTLTRTGTTHDLSIGSDGVLALSSGLDAYAEIVEAEVSTLKGEILTDPGIGIDYMGTVFKSVSKTHIWKYLVTQAVSALPFVVGIQSFTATFDSINRTMKYALSVLTDYGIVEVES